MCGVPRNLCCGVANIAIDEWQVVELLSLGFWFMRPMASLPGGLPQHLAEPMQLAIRRQWGLVVQRLCVWRRSLAVHAYWELASAAVERSAQYTRALQFVDWSPSSAEDAHNVAEYLHHQLGLAKSLTEEQLLDHTRALTFTVEQLRLPMLPAELAERPMAAVQEWALYAIQAVSDTTIIDPGGNSRSPDDRASTPVSSSSAPSSEVGSSRDRDTDLGPTDAAYVAAADAAASVPGKSTLLSRKQTRRQLALLELASACVVQSSFEFFTAQMPAITEALRPYLWSGAAVEPALHCILRLLRGCYHHPQPFFTAGDRFALNVRDSSGGIATEGGRLAPVSPAAAAQLGRYSVVMYPGVRPQSHLVRLAHLQDILFPNWAEPPTMVLRMLNTVSERAGLSELMRLVGIGLLSELPHASSLVEILAEVVVCMAAHAVDWAVEQLIMPFLKFRKRSDASAAYALVSMRALGSMLEPSSNFSSANAKMQRDVPMLLAPAIDLMLQSAYSQCGLQRVGIRYYPLPVDTFNGDSAEMWASQAEAFVTDFGPHPLGSVDPASADVRTVVSMATSHPPTARTPAQEAEDESNWRRLGMIKLIAYNGGGLMGGDESSVVRLSFGRVFLERASVEQWPLSLDPHLVWSALTHNAPGRSLLAHETTLAHAQYVAALTTTQPEDGRSVDDWMRLYVYAIGVLPHFDPSSIPAHVVVDKRGRCFLVRALAHPDDRVARAAAHALQRIMVGHMVLRVPLFKSMLALLGRVPEHDVAIRATTLAHFGQLISIWITELNAMDPFKLTSAAMLEPVEPYLAKLEAEAFIAMCHPHASVRLPAVELLYEARRLGAALAKGYERMKEMISGEAQQRERDAEHRARLEDLVGNEAEIRQARRAQRRAAAAARAASPYRRHGSPSPAAGAKQSNPESRCSRQHKHEHHGRAQHGSPSTHRSHTSGQSFASPTPGGGSSRRSHSSYRGGFSRWSGRPLSMGGSTMRSLASSWDEDEKARLSDAEDEHTYVQHIIQAEIDAEAARRVRQSQSTRAVTALEDGWGLIVATAVRQMLASSGDLLLDASTFAMPERLTLRDAAKASRSALWITLLVATFHTCVDANCTLLARNVRRALRRRIRRLATLDEVQGIRPDSLVATLHINWGSMLLAASGRPPTSGGISSLTRSSVVVSTRALEARIEALDEKRLGAIVSARTRASAARHAKAGLPIAELVAPRKTPRQARLEMHERRLGIFREDVAASSSLASSEAAIVKDPLTDEEDDAYGIMAQVDLHLRQRLLHLRSSVRWVRQSVVLSLASVHASSLIAVVRAAVRLYDDAQGKHAMLLARARRDAADAEEEARHTEILPGLHQVTTVDAPAVGVSPPETSDAEKDLLKARVPTRRALAELQRMQRELTRLMRMLAQHKGMAMALDECPDLLGMIISFIRRVGTPLFAPAERLLSTGRPQRGAGGLLELIDPNGHLNWCIDYLGLVGALSDAICRRRDLNHPPDYAALVAGVTEATWPVAERYELFTQLKFWSSHGAGDSIKIAEEVELQYRLGTERSPERRLLVANLLERGARRRQRYAHWAIAQLLSVGPILPVTILQPAQLDAELRWAAEGERQAAFVMLRPLLAFHFDQLLPIYYVHARSADPTLAALYQAALYMPVQLDKSETCLCVSFVRMTAIAALPLVRATFGEAKKGAPHDITHDAFVLSHEQNVATVVIWALLFLLSPEPIFRKDAAAALYALCDHVGVAAGVASGLGATAAAGGGVDSHPGAHDLPFVIARGVGTGGLHAWEGLDEATSLLSAQIFWDERDVELTVLQSLWPEPVDEEEDSIAGRLAFAEADADNDVTVAAAAAAKSNLVISRADRHSATGGAFKKAHTKKGAAPQQSAAAQMSAWADAGERSGAAGGAASSAAESKSLLVQRRRKDADGNQVPRRGVRDGGMLAAPDMQVLKKAEAELDAATSKGGAFGMVREGGGIACSRSVVGAIGTTDNCGAESYLCESGADGASGGVQAAWQPGPSPPPSPPAPSMATGTRGTPMRRNGLLAGGRIGRDSARRADAGRSNAIWKLAGMQPQTERGAELDGDDDEAEDEVVLIDEREQATVEQLVCERLGKTNGRVRSATDLHDLVLRLSTMAAQRMTVFSGAVLIEGGNVMLGLMDAGTRPFAIEVLLPWARQIALLEPRGSVTQLSRSRQAELREQGYCVAYPADCLQQVFEYTLVASASGLPESVCTFWRSLALAVKPTEPGRPPLNIAPTAAWVASQANRQQHERDQQTCRSLALFVKGLAILSAEEDALMRASRASTKGVKAAASRAKLAELRAASPDRHATTMAKRAKAVQMLQQASRQRREKTTRQASDTDAIAQQARLGREETQENEWSVLQHAEHMQQQDQERRKAQVRKEKDDEEKRRNEELEAVKRCEGLDSSAAATQMHFKGLGMKLADGRQVAPARLRRLSAATALAAGVPQLNLSKALEKQRGRLPLEQPPQMDKGVNDVQAADEKMQRNPLSFAGVAQASSGATVHDVT